MAKFTEDALMLGAQLKAEEQEASERRIARAIAYGTAVDDDDSDPNAPWVRARIARALYDAATDDVTGPWGEEPTAENVLDRFCARIFGCSFAETLEAWDREDAAGHDDEEEEDKQ